MRLHSVCRPSLFAAAIALLATWPATAHEGHHHNTMGTIHAVQAAQLDLETKDGKVESFQLTASTTYTRGSAAAKKADLKVGERAVVIYESKGGKDMAVEVKLSTGAHEEHEGHAALPADHDSLTGAEPATAPRTPAATVERR